MGDEIGNGIGYKPSVIESLCLKGNFTQAKSLIQDLKKQGLMDAKASKEIAKIIVEKFFTQTPKIILEESEEKSLFFITEIFHERFKFFFNDSSTSSQIFQFLYYSNRHLVLKKETWDYSFELKLLKAMRDYKCSDMNRLTIFRNAMYAQCWNAMRDTLKTSSYELTLERIIVSLMWSIQESPENIGKVAIKLYRCLPTNSTQPVPAHLETFTTNLLLDFVKELKKSIKRASSDEKKRCDMESKEIFSGLLLTFTSSLLHIFQFKNSGSRAYEFSDRFTKALSLYIPEFYKKIITTVGILCINTMSVIYEDYSTVKYSYHINSLKLLLPKQVKNADLRYSVLSIVLQTLLYVPPWNKNNASTFTPNLIVEILTPICKLFEEMSGTSGTNAVELFESQDNTKVDFVTFILRFVSDSSVYSIDIIKLLKRFIECIKGIYETKEPVKHFNNNINLVHWLYSISRGLLKNEFLTEPLFFAEMSYKILKQIPLDKRSKRSNCSYINMGAEVCYKSGDHKYGLELLCKALADFPEETNEPLPSFDYFKTLVKSEFQVCWPKIKYQSLNSETEHEDIQSFSVANYLSKLVSKELLAKYLVMELNSYFTMHYVLVDATINVGQELEKIGLTPTQKVLGLLGQIIGFWWEGSSDAENFCLGTCERAISFMNASISEPTDPQILILYAVTKAWSAFTMIRAARRQARSDMEDISQTAEERILLKVKDMQKEFSDVESGITYTAHYVGIGSINIYHEHEIASALISAIDILYTIIQFDEKEVKSWIGGICPALVLITMHMIAHNINIFGDTYSAIRAWHVSNTAARIFETKHHEFISGIELYKLMPLSLKITVSTLEELQAFGIESKNTNLNELFYKRLDLAKAAVALKEKKYEEGLEHLNKVLSVKNKSNMDQNCLVISEAYFLLALYHAATETTDIKIENYLDTLYSEMGQVGSAHSAFRLVLSLSRKMVPETTGWNDLFFNLMALNAKVEIGLGCLQILKSCGRSKELRWYATEALYAFQQNCLVSRSIGVILYVAEADFIGKRYKSCVDSLEAINKMLTSPDITTGIHRVEMSLSEIRENLKKYNISKNETELINVPNYKVTIAPIDLPEHLTPRRERSGKNASPTVLNRYLRLPRYMFHSLNCSCYICTHPTLIPLIIDYLHLNARYCSVGNGKGYEELMEMARLHHEKASLRILFHFERMALRLSQVFNAKKVGRDALERTYFPFIYKTGMGYLKTSMESSEDFENVYECWRSMKSGEKFNTSGNIFENLEPDEILSAFMYLKYFSSTNSIVEVDSKREEMKNIIANENMSSIRTRLSFDLLNNSNIDEINDEIEVESFSESFVSNQETYNISPDFPE